MASESPPDSSSPPLNYAPVEERRRGFSVYRYPNGVDIRLRRHPIATAISVAVTLLFAVLIGMGAFWQNVDPTSRASAAVLGVFLLMFAAFLLRQQATVPRIQCFDGNISCSWRSTFRRRSFELSRNQLQQVYGGEDRDGDGIAYYIGVVDAAGREHRLLSDAVLSRKAAIEVAKILRASAGLPKCEQDEADFDNW